jgi:hypothetical protein
MKRRAIYGVGLLLVFAWVYVIDDCMSLVNQPDNTRVVLGTVVFLLSLILFPASIRVLVGTQAAHDMAAVKAYFKDKL